MGTNCSLPFCLEDWGLLGFGMFTAVVAVAFALVVHALFVRCSYCADNYAHIRVSLYLETSLPRRVCSTVLR